MDIEDYIFIDKSKKKIISGVVNNSKLVEYYEEKYDDRYKPGDIIRARVLNVIDGINAAFLNIGEKHNAYLPYNEAILKNDNSYDKISDVLKQGSIELVQIKKSSYKDKGAKVTRNISLTGRYIIITPYDQDIKISRKIVNEDEKEKLIKIGKNIQYENIGMVFRVNSINILEKEIEKEYKVLINKFKKIAKEKNFLPIPKVIYKEKNLAWKLIRDILNFNNNKIITNDKIIYETLIKKKITRKNLIYDSDFNAKYDQRISSGLTNALSKEVELDNGGSIIIEETEALTSIDINTKKYTGGISHSNTSFEINMEAVIEIARQIRLRNLSGIIIVDLIKMKRNDHTTLVINKLKEELKKDRNRPYIVGLTKLGLLEITRERTINPLSELFIKECTNCKGKGFIYDY